MAEPEYALSLPISDIEPRRDLGRKFRIAGHVTAIDPSMSTTVVLSEMADPHHSSSSSIIVDLSLCVNPEPPDDPFSRANAGGWRLYTQQQQRQQVGTSTIVPPALKSMCMVIGYLRKHGRTIDTDFAQHQPRSSTSSSTDPVLPHAANVRQPSPHTRFFIEAILVKELDHTFDLNLWNYTARLRSQHEWKHVPLPTSDKGKRRA